MSTNGVDKLNGDDYMIVIVGDENCADIRNNNESSQVIDPDATEDNKEAQLGENNELHRNTTDPKRSEDSFAKMLQNNTLMTSIVKKCMVKYKSEGMPRVIERILKPAFENATDAFKESKEFRVILKSTLKLLELDPTHKFTHIKRLCNSLKLEQKKKNVPFVTLPRVETTTSTSSRHHFADFISTSPKKWRRKKNISIAHKRKLDSESNIDIINLESEPEDSDDIIFVDEQTKPSVTETRVIHDNSNTENKTLPHTEDSTQMEHIERQDNVHQQLCLEIDGTNSKIAAISAIQTESVIKINQASNISEEARKFLLTPISEVEFECQNDISIPKKDSSQINLDDNMLLLTVEKIEEEINHYQFLIEEYEQKEVENLSSNFSPYLMVDAWKRRTVTLYQQLCMLTGEEAVKKKTIRLEVQGGHPSGPVQRLEAFLNSNLDTTGNPMFPDFCDVITCVRKANLEDKMGWSKAQVMREAYSLFKQCGEALCKRRRKREWRDMLSYVKQELPEDDDPAARDPVLMAKLEQNKRTAKEKENEILERYTLKEYLPSTLHTPLDPRLGNMAVQDTADSSDPEEPTPIVTSTTSGFGEISSTTSTTTIEAQSSITDFPHQTIVPSSKYKEVQLDVSTNKIDVSDRDSPVQIKMEPTERVQCMLQSLGTNFKATVFDIEDPFLIIDISSDSSYSDTDNEYS